MTVKIASFNANSIRARLDIITAWLLDTSADILCIQETKVQDKDFPLEAFEKINYHCVFKGQKSYNGVAIISKFPVENLLTGFDGKGEDEGSRIIYCKIKNINIINVYIPQGSEVGTEKFKYKLTWLDRLHDYLKNNFAPDSPLILTGDFNVAPERIDLYDPDKFYGSVGFHFKEHKGLEKLKSWGLVDIFRKHESRGEQYSFYDYRINNSVKRKMGWRLDHIWATEVMAEKSVKSYIDIRQRLMEKPSDHTFIVSEFKLNA
jgi:exodeoxyribonuclease-3